MTNERFDTRTYGRSFADVYDTWYSMAEDTSDTVRYLLDLCDLVDPHDSNSRVLEIGIGTGRLAIPLAQAGCQVSGIDSSDEMLSRLMAKALGAGLEIPAVTGDASDPRAWPAGPFDLVVAAFNFVFNLIGEDAKVTFLQNARTALGPNGRLVVESYVPANDSPAEDSSADNSTADGPTAEQGATERLGSSGGSIVASNESLPSDVAKPDDDRREADGATRLERRVDLKEISFDSVILIASETDHESGMVTGQHVELRDGEPVRLRPWQVHVVTPSRLDVLAERAGLVLDHRHGDWHGSPFSHGSHRSVSVYRRGS